MEFKDMYQMQVDFQNTLVEDGYAGLAENITLPADDINIFKYSVLHLISELGEVLEADKRWKTSRNIKFVEGDKKKELIDCLIIVFNMLISSGMQADEIVALYRQKVKENYNRTLLKGNN